MDESYKARKIDLINLSTEVRFRPQSGELLGVDTVLVDRLITHLLNNTDSKIEISVSHVYPAEEYYQEGLQKSDNLKKYFIAEGVSPLRIANTTFLDRRSKYPYNSEFRKVVVVLTNINPQAR